MDFTKLMSPPGDVVWPGAVHVKKYPWVNVGSMNTAEAAVSSAEARQASMEVTLVAAGKSCIYTPADGQVAVAFRVRSDGTENDDNILDMFWAAEDIGDRIYSRMARLTCTQGTLVYSGSILFADEIVASLNKWITVPVAVHPGTPDDNMAQYVLNCHGVQKFAFVYQTKVASNLYVDARRI